MKKTYLVTTAFLLATALQATPQFLCIGLCAGNGGWNFNQVMATGADAATAFSNLKSKCPTVANGVDLHVATQAAVNFNGYNLLTDAALDGAYHTATSDNSCVQLGQ